MEGAGGPEVLALLAKVLVGFRQRIELAGGECVGIVLERSHVGVEENRLVVFVVLKVATSVRTSGTGNIGEL